MVKVTYSFRVGKILYQSYYWYDAAGLVNDWSHPWCGYQVAEA